MRQFSFQAYDDQGLKQKGELYAGDIELARKELDGRSYAVVDLIEVNDSKSSGGLKIFKNTADELELVTSELALLLNNGMRIDRALELLVQSGQGREITPKLSEVLTRIRAGVSLSEALKEQGELFDRLFVSLVDLGEKTGRLGDVFSGLSVDLKFRKQLKKKIVQALTYPSLIMMICLGALLFIFNFIIPRMASMFEGAVELPFYTEIMLGSSTFIQTYQYYFVIGSGLTLLSLTLIKNKQALLSHFDGLFLSLPGCRKLISRLECIRFASAMNLTLRYGVTLESALQLAAMTVKNSKIREKLMGVRQQVRSGSSLSSALAPLSLFPPVMRGLLSAGEESASLAEVFAEVSDRSREDFEDWVAKITSLLEPLMIVVMGAIVGVIVIVMLLSIISIQDISF
ncbi:MAG: type II secretion system F family protein [Lentisphaeraceae bacterium]|nr:type II secretion system F family protein [Lentisphaeraceae bacterium]